MELAPTHFPTGTGHPEVATTLPEAGTTDERTPTRLGRYEIAARLGRGGMGVVYRARDPLLGRDVAIKTLLPGAWSYGEMAGIWFWREAEVVARVRHQNVVEIFDLDLERDVPFIVMEYLEGEDLHAILQREGRLTVPRAMELLLPVFDAVATAHERGVVHRDLKPANVFVSGSGGRMQPKVLDFGVAAFLSAAGVSSEPDSAGTPLYMAPEVVAREAQPAPSADQYALGTMLYECVTGETPFAGCRSLLELIVRSKEGAYPPASKRNPSLGRGIDAVIARALAPRASARFASVREFGAALLARAPADVAGRFRGVFGAEAGPCTP